MKVIFIAGEHTSLAYAEIVVFLYDSLYAKVDRDIKFGISKVKNQLKSIGRGVWSIDILDKDISNIINTAKNLQGCRKVGFSVDEIQLESLQSNNFVGTSANTEQISDITKKKKPVIGINFVGMLEKEVKKLLSTAKKNVGSFRFVLPIDDSGLLSLGTIKKNSIDITDSEYIVLNDNEGLQLYKVVQNTELIDRNSAIEYEKPYTDTVVGTLPARLANIMCNLGCLANGDIVWDPFAGSGTIASVAAVQGINVFASDISNNSVIYVQENLKWITERFGVYGESNVFKFDILSDDRYLLSKIKQSKIKAIVTEPFMGPPQKRTLYYSRIEELQRGYIRLVKALFEVAKQTLPMGGRLVFIAPVYKSFKKNVKTHIADLAPKRWTLINEFFLEDLIWSRKSSIIQREIIVFQK